MGSAFLLLITFERVDRRLLKAELDSVNLIGMMFLVITYLINWLQKYEKLKE
jgi:hypothetical protein